MSEWTTKRVRDDSHETARTLLTTREAAERLGVHERTVRRAIARGDIPARKLRGVYRIDALVLGRITPPRSPPLVTLVPARDAMAPLPRPLTPFIGRHDDLIVVTTLLQDAETRLLTLTGPGGIGKTRLAIEAASAVQAVFPDGVVFVNLAPVAHEELVLAAVAEALGLKESGQHDLRQRVRAFLRGRRLLLLLDNCEHLPGATPLIAQLLSDAPAVTALATSRAPLHISGERELPVPALSLPTSDRPITADTLLASDAGRLFVNRARNVDPTFSLDESSAVAIVEICTRLDGLPLAIELAAARSKVLPPRHLRDRLERRLPLLTRGARDAPTRQGAMRDAIAWSYNLLSTDEQRLFRRLGVFAGGCTLEAAAAVLGIGDVDEHVDDAIAILDLIGALVDQSLLMRELGPDDEPRFRMLETIREYGLERLEAGEEAAARSAHALCFLRFAQTLRPLASTRSTRAPLDRLAADDANMRAALNWLDARGQTADVAAMVASCWVLWYFLSRLHEGERWLARALTKSDEVSATIGGGF